MMGQIDQENGKSSAGVSRIAGRNLWANLEICQLFQSLQAKLVPVVYRYVPVCQCMQR